MVHDAESFESYWDIVFFKVEDKVFGVPKFQFEQSSDVFANMFSLPSPTTNSEGRTKANPIVLESYKVHEFTCLLKVMYPTADSLISGTSIDLRLEKFEWINVLKLSTIWNMQKIRDYAIHRLSNTDISLTPLEKIQLARAHRVGKWLEEGLVSLTSPDHNSTLEELASLGHKTAFEILWIQNQALKEPSNKLLFRKDSIKCDYCSTSNSLLNHGHTCRQCRAILAADEVLSFAGSAPISNISPPDRTLTLSSIQCSQCTGNPFYGLQNIYCASCSNPVSYYANIRVTPLPPVNAKLIKDIFGAEIDSLGSTPSEPAA